MFKLYQFEGCPFCAKVRAKLADLNLEEGKDFELIESSRGTPGRAEVVKLGGQSMVPFLVDGSIKMYESDDIVAYLEKKFSK